MNCEVNLILNWSKGCVIIDSENKGKFAITETKLYVPIVTVSTQDNAKLFQQLKSVFGRIIKWKYKQAYEQNWYLNHLVNPSFQGLNILFVFAFENEDGRTSSKSYYLPKVEVKDYNVIINGNIFLINQ